MVGPSKRKVSASRAKRISRSVNDAQIGTHIRPLSSDRGDSAANVDFSSERKRRRAEKGVVDQVLPQTRTRETKAEYERRASRRNIAHDTDRFRSIRRIIIIVLVVLAVLAAAGAVGSAAYFGSVSERMGLKDSDAQSALVAQKADAPYYMLVVGEYFQAGTEYTGPEVLILARIDEAAQSVTLVSVPPNVQVVLRDGNVHRIADAQLMGGDSYLVSTVANFAEVSISHIVKIDNAGLIRLVDELGGVSVEVPEEVDDPNVGDIYIPRGLQTLDGQAALTFARATNYKQGEGLALQNQRSLLLAVTSKLLEHQGFGAVTMLDSIADTLRTDYSALDAISAVHALSQDALDKAYSVEVPGYESLGSANEVEYFVAYDDDWETMMEAVDSGGDPTLVDEQSDSVDPGTFSITVRNGAEITGAAAQLSDTLTAGGFVVQSVGNADNYVYDETLIIYNDSVFEPAARTVAEYLGVGRTVESAGFYSFDTNILVILGKDWKPLN